MLTGCLHRGIQTINATEDCVELLRDDKMRAEFHVHLKSFLATLDDVLPRPAALEFVNDAKQLAHIQARARNRYRSDERIIGEEVGAKVRRLIDEHVESQGIDPRIPPIAITDADFDAHVEKEVSPRAKASEMAHALRHHIRKKRDEDPVRFGQLSERLEKILAEFGEQWDKQVDALRQLIETAREGRTEDDGVVAPMYAPFYALLKKEIVGDETPSDDEQERIADLTADIVDHMRQEIGIVNFWNKAQAREGLRGWIFTRLDDADVIEWGELDRVSSELMSLAKANHRMLTGDAR